MSTLTIARRLLLLMLCLMACASYAADADAPPSFAQLLAEAKQYREQHQYHQALAGLQAAEGLAQTPVEQAELAGALGQTYYFNGQLAQAEHYLKQASKAPTLDARQRARYHNTLASLYAGQGNPAQAGQLYQTALTLAGNDRILALEIRFNQIRLQPNSGQYPLLQTLLTDIAQLPAAAEQARLYLYAGEQLRKLGTEGNALAFEALAKSHDLAAKQPDSRLYIESTAALARLYQDQQRIDEALQLAQTAISQLQSGQNGAQLDLLLPLEQQQATLFAAKQQWRPAREALQRAVRHIQAIRQDIPVTYQDGRSSFRETFAPLYLNLADLLLREAKPLPTDAAQPLLKQARDVLELLKQSELEDFLGNRCLLSGAQQTDASAIDSSTATAVLYPVMLPDRLELLLETGDRLSIHTVAVTANTLESTAKAFASGLRGNQSETVRAQQLYHWLVAPVAERLQHANIHTLITIPDGALRLVPMAVLHDGQHYLVERYATATTPALSVLHVQAAHQRRWSMLLAGLSIPGSSVSKLPWEMVSGYVGGDLAERMLRSPGKTRAIILPDNARLKHLDKASQQKLLADPSVQQQLQQAFSLPGVKTEVEQIEQQLDNTTLLDDRFTVAAFRQQVAQQNYPIIHIASHGKFGNKAENTFIMAYDDVIRAHELQDILKTSVQRQQPIELLTLSACQTAQGDDRAPLGISGLALQARAQSALGSLWPINDTAAQMLMATFYRHLGEPGTTKAEALRQAQLELLHSPNLREPYFWSPFILVGNWL